MRYKKSISIWSENTHKPDPDCRKPVSPGFLVFVIAADTTDITMPDAS
ncbi:hypothetical protein ACFL6I_02220 [candidate division KSB1 bacterium]